MLIDIVLGHAVGRGGLERVLSLVANELKRRGHSVRLFQSRPPDYEEWLETIPSMYYYDPVAMHFEPNYEGELALFKQALGYRKLVLEMGVPDVVLATHTPYFSAMCKLALAYLDGDRPPVVSWIHGPVEAYGAGELLRYADAHLAISQGVGLSIQQAIGNDIPLFKVGNPLDFSSIERVPRPENGVEFLYIGRLDKRQKRLDVLFNALVNVSGDYRLTIIGDGPNRDVLHALATQMGLERHIRWLGWKENPWAFVEEVSALLLTSEFEGFGVVLVEALIRGIPVVSSRCAGPDEIVSGENGWLFEPGDTHQLAEILQKLVDRSLPLPVPELCIQSVWSYSKDVVVDRIEGALHQVRALVPSRPSFVVRPRKDFKELNAKT